MSEELEVGADPAFVGCADGAAGVSTKGFNRGEWQAIETFSDPQFTSAFSRSEWFLVATTDGRVTEAHPFILDGDARLWACARGANCSDPRWPSDMLNTSVTHWMPLPDPPASVDTGPQGEDAQRLSSSGSAVGEAETPAMLEQQHAFRRRMDTEHMREPRDIYGRAKGIPCSPSTGGGS